MNNFLYIYSQDIFKILLQIYLQMKSITVGLKNWGIYFYQFSLIIHTWYEKHGRSGRAAAATALLPALWWNTGWSSFGCPCQSTVRSRGAQGGPPIAPTYWCILWNGTCRTLLSSWIWVLSPIHGVTNFIWSSCGRHWWQDTSVLRCARRGWGGAESPSSCRRFRPGGRQNRVQFEGPHAQYFVDF